MKENRDALYLERIIESIDRAEGFVAGVDFDEFASNEMMQDATSMQLINIGEMVSRLSEEFRDKHDYLPWHKVIGMRNQIAHGYFEIKADEVWRTCEEDLPKLKEQLLKSNLDLL